MGPVFGGCQFKFTEVTYGSLNISILYNCYFLFKVILGAIFILFT